MELDTLFIGVVLGLGPGLVAAAFIVLRAMQTVTSVLKELASAGKRFASILKAPSGPGGFAGLAATFLPLLTQAGGPQ